tara:strand:- start:1250 stop:2005 length:756 start_codon:yes stop_codon:yes gene_type:complete
MELLLGDCLELMTEIKDNSVDLLFCDLPYGQTSCKWDCLIDLEKFWKEVNRVCKIDTPMLFTCSVKFGNSLINSNTKNFRYDLIWVKSAAVGFLNAKKMPMKKHEMIYVFYRKLPKIYTENISLHHTHKFIKEKKITRTDEGCNALYGKETNKKFIYDENGKLRNSEPMYDPPLPNSLLECKSEKGKHSTQKPISLMEWILKYYSREGGLVLDPTMGSGSMGVACKNMNRKFIGIEKDESIFKVAMERLHV